MTQEEFDSSISMIEETLDRIARSLTRIANALEDREVYSEEDKSNLI